MNLAALQHLVKAIRALANDCEVIILGSASLLASWPDLGEPDGPLATTYDADVCPQPFDETTAEMLQQAMGENQAFHLRHGYHADILRDQIFETLPPGWQNRLVAVKDCPKANALDPHDLAAVKLLVGRSKDISLVRHLALDKKIVRETVEARLDSIQKSNRALISSAKALAEAFK